MLQTLILENFKPFGQRQVIPLAPITLIFGANSSGKSSILQSLLLLKQTLDEAESQDIPLVPRGKLVDLGSFREFVHRHDLSRVCEITPLPAFQSMIHPMQVSGASERTGIEIPPQSGIGFHFGFDPVGSTVKLVGLPYYWGQADEAAYRLLPEERSSASRARRGYSETGPRRDAPRSLGELVAAFELAGGIEPMWEGRLGYFAGELAIAHPLWDRLHREVVNRSRDRFLEQSRRLNAAAGPESGTTELADQLERLSGYSRESFVEDMRTNNANPDWVEVVLSNFLPAYEPDDDSDEESDDALDTTQADGNSINALDWISREMVDLACWCVPYGVVLRGELEKLVYLGPFREQPERHYLFTGAARGVGRSGRGVPELLYRHSDLIDKVNDVLTRLDVGYVLKVHRIDDPELEGFFALQLVDRQSGTTVSVADVGFGISQILPILLQAALSRPALVLVEQPELHLHPRLQAELGSLFAQCIADPATPLLPEERKPERNQFIIETHSEHLILRLQKLIRRGELKADDVSVIYVMKDEQGSRCYPLRLDDEGDFIDAWPEGFFEEGYREMFE